MVTRIKSGENMSKLYVTLLCAMLLPISSNAELRGDEFLYYGKSLDLPDSMVNMIHTINIPMPKNEINHIKNYALERKFYVLNNILEEDRAYIEDRVVKQIKSHFSDKHYYYNIGHQIDINAVDVRFHLDNEFLEIQYRVELNYLTLLSKFESPITPNRVDAISYVAYFDRGSSDLLHYQGRYTSNLLKKKADKLELEFDKGDFRAVDNAKNDSFVKGPLNFVAIYLDTSKREEIMYFEGNYAKRLFKQGFLSRLLIPR